MHLVCTERQNFIIIHNFHLNLVIIYLILYYIHLSAVGSKKLFNPKIQQLFFLYHLVHQINVLLRFKLIQNINLYLIRLTTNSLLLN